MSFLRIQEKSKNEIQNQEKDPNGINLAPDSTEIGKPWNTYSL